MAIAEETRHYDYTVKSAAHEDWTATRPLLSSSVLVYGESIQFDAFSSLPVDEDDGSGGDLDYGLFAPLSTSSVTTVPSFLTSPSVASTYTDYATSSNTGARMTTMFGDSSSFVGDSEPENFTSPVKVEHEQSEATNSFHADVCRDLILRHLVQDIEATCSKLALSSDPLLWTANDCVRWVEEMCEQFQLPAPPRASYSPCIATAGGGQALLAMRIEELCACFGADAGDMLYSQLQIWSSAADTAKTAIRTSQVDDMPASYTPDNSHASWEPYSSATNATNHNSKLSCKSMPTRNDWRRDIFHIETSSKEFELSSNSSCVSAEHEVLDDEFINEFPGKFGAQCTFTNISYQQQQQQQRQNQQQFSNCKVFDVNQHKFTDFGMTMHHYSEEANNIYSSFAATDERMTGTYPRCNTGASMCLADGERGQAMLCSGSVANTFTPSVITGAPLPTPAMRERSTAASAMGVVAATTGTIHLWHFIRELLDQPLEYSSCVRWVNRDEGTFKIESSHNLARIWGQRKNRSQMNYDKLSRSLRQYYKKGIIQKPEKKQRLVYKFLPPYNL